MLGEGVGDAAGLVELRRRDPEFDFIFLPCEMPHARQGVLQDRQLVGIVADGVDELRNDEGVDAATEQAGWPGNRRLDLPAVQPGCQKLGAVAKQRIICEGRYCHGRSDPGASVGGGLR